MLCKTCKQEIPDSSAFCPWCGKKQAAAPRKALKRPNGAGSVYKLSGRRKKPWAASKNRVIIGYYEKKTDALAALEKLSGKSLTERYNMTFKEVFEEWKVEHYREIGEKGVESYDRAYDVFEPLHGRKFRSLRTADFQAVLDKYMDKSHSTVNKYKQLITQMSTWAVREEICTTNFARFVKLPENVKKEKEIFTAAEIKKLEKDGSDAAKIVLMLLATGMRIGELFSLPLKDYTRIMWWAARKQKPAGIALFPSGRRESRTLNTSPRRPMAICSYPATRGRKCPPTSAAGTTTRCWKSSR